MALILGLDMGTSSLGWCLRRDDEFVDMGARIFHDGRDPKRAHRWPWTGALPAAQDDGAIVIWGGARR